MSRPNQTGFKGVYKKGDRYCAIGWIDRKGHYLGYFDTIEEASMAYLEWEKNPKINLRPGRHHADTNKEERSSPEMYAIVENVFRKMLRPKIQAAPCAGGIAIDKIQRAVESVRK